MVRTREFTAQEHQFIDAYTAFNTPTYLNQLLSIQTTDTKAQEKNMPVIASRMLSRVNVSKEIDRIEAKRKAKVEKKAIIDHQELSRRFNKEALEAPTSSERQKANEHLAKHTGYYELDNTQKRDQTVQLTVNEQITDLEQQLDLLRLSKTVPNAIVGDVS